MKKEAKLINKVKRLIRRLNVPRYLHYYGPKIYEFYEHLVALIIMAFCRLSYRRTKKLLDLLGIRCPSKSALQYTMKRMPFWLWNKALELTSGINHNIIALDGTGFSVINPSYHYLRRIDGKLPKKYIKLSASFDTKLKKWCSSKIRVIPRHDMKDAQLLLKDIQAKKIVADKAYDAEKLHKYCAEHNIEVHIPLKNYGEAEHYMWSCRRKAAKHFRLRTYHRRELIESGFSSLKRKFGSGVNSKTARTIRAEVNMKMICHNLFSYFI